MEPPHFGLSRYILRGWRSLFPDNARKGLLKQASSLPLAHRSLLSIIHDRLPDGSYKDLDTTQQSLLDAGIYIAAHRPDLAASVCKTILETCSTDKEWFQWLIAELENISVHGSSIEKLT